ncbi:hypothetical protein ABZV29_16790 [Streptomyces sp. NPDC005236]|uniref:hypothetical protein n=1 Tax=Streptomyces sp. NPDC005236 TaxID=3157028 RepID=UPI0033BF92AE
MTRAETPAEARRRALLGDDVIDYINACVDAAPEPEPGEWVEALRRIFSSRGDTSPRSKEAVRCNPRSSEVSR